MKALWPTARQRLAITALAGVLLAGIALPAAAAPNPNLRGATWDSIKGLPEWTGLWTPSRPPAGVADPGPSAGGFLGGTAPLTPKYAALKDKRMAAVRGEGEKGVAGIPLSNSGYCLPNGTPANMAPVSHEYVYSPGRVTILLENSEIRRIWTDGRSHVPEDESNPSFSGDSIGHWDGDALVVETVNIFPEAELYIGQRVTAKTRVKERIARVGDHLRIDTVVEDPELFTKPWAYTRWYEREDRAPIDYESCTAGDRAKLGGDTLLDIDFNLSKTPVGADQ